MEKALDREGAPAPLILSSFRRTASRVVAVCYSLYAIIGVSTFLLEPLSQLAIFFSFSMTLDIVWKSLLFSIIMGMVGGVLPSLRAARMGIVDALRES